MHVIPSLVVGKLYSYVSARASAQMYIRARVCVERLTKARTQKVHRFVFFLKDDDRQTHAVSREEPSRILILTEHHSQKNSNSNRAPLTGNIVSNL